MGKERIRSTTVVAVKRNGHVAMAGDGQVTAGNTVMKGNARKVRKIYDGKIITGFAGSVADAFTLFDRFESKIKEFNGDLTRAAVELAKLWRTEKMLQKLEALLLVQLVVCSRFLDQDVVPVALRTNLRMGCGLV